VCRADQNQSHFASITQDFLALHHGHLGIVAGYMYTIATPGIGQPGHVRFINFTSDYGGPISLHPGHINMSHCDGSVHRVSKDISYEVATAMVGIDDGTITSEP